ncbi:MAG: HAMP domain-containing histidine kinase [Bacteroidales bacterium]|nr:HAMP domain-containing histidine kinase [Bacteroidales bacterium]MCF8333932.1 HAMP domain-containing histidine kinase [Bacteroidales bacterium]
MKRYVLILIILTTSFALIGSVIIQIYWVKKGYNLREELFDSSVNIELKTVVNEILSYQNNEIPEEYKRKDIPCDETTPVVYKIKPQLLDSLVQKHLHELEVSADYAYGIYEDSTKEFIIGHYQGYAKKVKNSRYQASLSCATDNQQYYLALYFSDRQGIILDELSGWVILSLIFILILIIGFYFSANTMLKQKKLSEMKNDFVNNMTHEFKTPISTVNLTGEMLLKEKVLQDKEKVKRYTRIILDENNRLKKQVEQVLQIAVIDRGEFKLKRNPVDIHDIVSSQVNTYGVLVRERDGQISKHLNAEEYEVIGDRTHLENIVSNLLDNANKYVTDTPHIHVYTSNKNSSVVVSVQDNGIGIDAENQKQIFKNLYRVPTGNIHNVKGFGLGLYYVKQMVEAHGGTISLDSEPGIGSTFSVYLPIKQQSYEEQQK